MLAPQNAPLDTLAAGLLDSAALDTAAVESTLADTAAVDTTDALTRLSTEVGEAGRLLVTGEWDLFWRRLYEGLAGLVIEFIPKIVSALFVFLLFYAVYRIVSSVFSRILHRSKRVDSGLQSLLFKTYRVVMLSFIAVMVLSQLGVNVAALLAGLSIVGIAVGFAARDSLENFISGITILLDKPFRVGDNVEINDVYGTIEEITLRSTRLRTLRNVIMVMPNTQMVNKQLLNHTMLGVVRVDVPFGIAYKEYPEAARAVVLGLARDDSRLHPDYQPKVVVTGLNDSSVDMELQLYLANPRLEVPVRFEYTERIREALREAGIEIPFPHLQLFIDEAKAFEHTRLMLPPPGAPASDRPPPDA